MTDQEIIQHIRDGRRTKAFTRLYRYFPKVKALVRQHGGTADDAADVFQEALIIICRKCTDPGFTLTSSLDTYLYSVCRFVWSDECRKRKKMPSAALTDKPGDDLAEYVENEEKYKLAESAFLQLGEKCKELLNLFYIAKLNMLEISTRLGYGSEHSARNQKYKCLESSREIYRRLISQEGEISG